MCSATEVILQFFNDVLVAYFSSWQAHDSQCPVISQEEPQTAKLVHQCEAIVAVNYLVEPQEVVVARTQVISKKAMVSLVPDAPRV